MQSVQQLLKEYKPGWYLKTSLGEFEHIEPLLEKQKAK